jgi:hypothetical protein
MKKFNILIFSIFITFGQNAFAVDTPVQEEIKTAEVDERLKDCSNMGSNFNQASAFNLEREKADLKPCAIPESFKRAEVAATQCVAPEDKVCDSGKVWNCTINKCLVLSDNDRVETAARKCNAFPEDKKAECLAEVQTFKDEKEIEKDPGKSLEKKTKSLGILGTGAQGAYAAYQLFTKTGKMFSMPKCFASPMGLAAGVASFMGQMNLKKQTKTEHKMLAEQYKRLEELKDKQGLTYEIQVMALEYYVMALESSKRIADAHAKQYKMDMMIYGAVAAIGTAEAIYRPICPGMCDVPGGLCGKKAAIGAGIGLGFSTMLMSTAKGASSKYSGRLAKVKKVLEDYKKLFGNFGGLATSTGMSGTTTSTITNITNTGLDTSNITTLDGDLSGAKHGLPGHCATKDGEVDPGCDTCAANPNSCKSFPSFSSLPSQLQGFGEKAGVGNIIDDGNAILSGKLTANEANQAAIGKKTGKVIAARRAIINHFEKQSIAVPPQLKGLNPIKAAMTFAAVNAGKLGLASNSATPWDLSNADGTNAISSYMKDKNLKKEFAKSSASSRPTSSSTASTNFKDMNLDDIDLGVDTKDAELENPDELLATSEEESKEAEKINFEESPDVGIVQDRKVSLFSLISNRFNVLRIKKRLGKKRQ